MRAAATSSDRPIDLVHLERQTLGDRELEREILSLFVRQSEMLGARIGGEANAIERLTIAHTLKGSARAIGAFRVAEAAEAVENALASMAKAAVANGFIEESTAEPEGGAHLLAQSLTDLAHSIDEANAVIAVLKAA